MKKAEKYMYRSRFKNDIFNKIRQKYRENNLSEEDIAFAIDRNVEFVKSFLRGDEEIDINTSCDIARALGTRLEVELKTLD